MAFLSTRVSCPTSQDMMKLDHLMRYIKSTLNDGKSLSKLLTWVDASYAVHPDMRGQNWGCHVFWHWSDSHLIIKAKIKC